MHIQLNVTIKFVFRLLKIWVQEFAFKKSIEIFFSFKYKQIRKFHVVWDTKIQIQQCKISCK